MSPVIGLLVFAAAIALGVLMIIFIVVPLLKGIGWVIGAFFKGIGLFFMHIFDFIGGIISDVVRCVGSIIAMLVLLPLVPLNVIIGRWSAAGHFANSIARETKVAGLCLYRAFLRRPLKLVFLHGLLEGVEQRVPEAMAGSPGADKPSKQSGKFEGYTIVGSLRGGGSGAKLYVAEPNEEKRRRIRSMPDRVVIKSFALADGSSLPQIIRESRALESAKQLGLVVDHQLDTHRFFYVMPYHPGEHLGVITRQMHAESESDGLKPHQLHLSIGYVCDLLETLTAYHNGGLWHKDVKPENIIVHDGEAHLVDLGLVTPLRSAMTLTTHGTEYFRDPELVRMALRGVKVHQVDGAKFDIYAVGAVMYFVLENTFPAHGGLSTLTKRTPEALKWIVRRAMADYNQRYETADAMLRDIEHVRTASDPWSLRPADLPSMKGSSGDDAAVIAASHNTDSPAASSPVPPNGPPAQAAPTWAQRPAASSAAAKHRRPRLRVTNWWTGEYVVDEPATVAGAATPHLAQPRRFNAQPAVARRGNHTRMAASEQLKSAQARATAMRRRAAEHRARVHGRSAVPTASGSSAALVGVMMFLLAGLGTGGYLLLRGAAPNQSRVMSVSDQGGVYYAKLSHDSSNESIADYIAGMSVVVDKPSRKDARIVVVNDHPAKANRLINGMVDRIIDVHEAKAFDVVELSTDEEAALRAQFERMTIVDGAPAQAELKRLLDEYDLEGILRFTVPSGEGEPYQRLKFKLLKPTSSPSSSNRAIEFRNARLSITRS